LLVLLLAGCSRDTPPAASGEPSDGNTTAIVDDRPASGGTPAPGTAAPASDGKPAATPAAPASGGAPTATASAPATGTPCLLSTVDSYDALGTGVVHSNGMGGTFCNSTPLGIYSYELALAACASHAKDAGRHEYLRLLLVLYGNYCRAHEGQYRGRR
jgi:hypothetical protein